MDEKNICAAIIRDKIIIMRDRLKQKMFYMYIMNIQYVFIITIYCYHKINYAIAYYFITFYILADLYGMCV